MRLEVAFQDRFGLVWEMLDLLVSRTINLRGIEVAGANPVVFMPTERDSHTMHAILAAMPKAVLSIDLKGQVGLVNPAAALLFNLSEEKLISQPVSLLVCGFNFNRWLEDASCFRRPLNGSSLPGRISCWISLACNCRGTTAISPASVALSY